MIQISYIIQYFHLIFWFNKDLLPFVHIISVPLRAIADSFVDGPVHHSSEPQLIVSLNIPLLSHIIALLLTLPLRYLQ